jgi:putative ABC transport system substrate-binding protein
LLQQRRRIVDFGAKHRLVMAGNWADWANDGLLLTYGPNPAVAMGLVAGYLDAILKGAAPADLPMSRPTRFELVINMNTARVLGITLPNSILAQADTVID